MLSVLILIESDSEILVNEADLSYDKYEGRLEIFIFHTLVLLNNGV